MQNTSTSEQTITDQQAMKNVRTVVDALAGVTVGLIVAVLVIV